MQPVRYSNLRAMAKSPAHYLAAVHGERTDTPGMRLGRLVHSLVLEGGSGVVVWDGERRGNSWKEFKAANDCAEIVTAKEAGQGEAIAAAVLAHPVAARLLRGPDVQNERREVWSMDGLDCALRYDALGPTWLADLKTTTDAEPRAFLRHAGRMNYHAQCAWYRSALVNLGNRIDDVYLVAVETDPPYAVTPLHLTAAVLDQGELLWRGWWQRLLTCQMSNLWPGYAAAPIEWELNEWEESMSDLDFETTAAPTVNAADKYRQLKAEMNQLADTLRADRLDLLEKLRAVDAAIAEIAPVKRRRVRKALGGNGQEKVKRSRKSAEVTA